MIKIQQAITKTKLYAAFKVCILGNGGVGKSTLMHRYLTGQVKLDTEMTIGLDIGVRKLDLNGEIIKLQIWDFAGEERFRYFVPGYSRGASGAIFVHDLSRPSTIFNIGEWIDVFRPFPADPERKIPLIMVGGKADLKPKGAVSKRFYERLAKKYNFIDYFETSSVTGKNINFVFELLTKLMLEKANEE